MFRPIKDPKSSVNNGENALDFPVLASVARFDAAAASTATKAPISRAKSTGIDMKSIEAKKMAALFEANKKILAAYGVKERANCRCFDAITASKQVPTTHAMTLCTCKTPANRERGQRGTQGSRRGQDSRGTRESRGSRGSRDAHSRSPQGNRERKASRQSKNSSGKNGSNNKGNREPKNNRDPNNHGRNGKRNNDTPKEGSRTEGGPEKGPQTRDSSPKQSSSKQGSSRQGNAKQPQKSEAPAAPSKAAVAPVQLISYATAASKGVTVARSVPVKSYSEAAGCSSPKLAASVAAQPVFHRAPPPAIVGTPQPPTGEAPIAVQLPTASPEVPVAPIQVAKAPTKPMSYAAVASRAIRAAAPATANTKFPLGTNGLPESPDSSKPNISVRLAPVVPVIPLAPTRPAIANGTPRASSMSSLRPSTSLGPVNTAATTPATNQTSPSGVMTPAQSREVIASTISFICTDGEN